MAKITITIDGDKVTVNKSTVPIKIEKENKKFFIIIRKNKDDSNPLVKFVTDNYIEAVNKIQFYAYDAEYIYRLYVQNENETISPYHWIDWDIDR